MMTNKMKDVSSKCFCRVPYDRGQNNPLSPVKALAVCVGERHTSPVSANQAGRVVSLSGIDSAVLDLY